MSDDKKLEAHTSQAALKLKEAQDKVEAKIANQGRQTAPVQITEGEVLAHDAIPDPDPSSYVDFGADVLSNENLADDAPPPAPTPVSRDEAMIRVMESMEKIVARQESTRQIPYNEVKPVSSFNPTGDRNHPQFSRPTHMDGILLNSLMHTAEEIKLFNQLKPGRYWERRIEVRRGSSGEIDLVRLGGRMDQRYERAGRFPTLVSMLEFIIAERKDKERKRREGLYEADEAI